MAIVSYRKDGEVAAIVVDRPPVNAINAEVRSGLCDGVERAEADPAVKAVVIACAGRTFLSGADLAELSGQIGEPSYHHTLARIENCSKPVLAAMHGTALGGGLETAMACHYRCATAGARMGMPEITLGIIPGAGGTQRLPRLIGAHAALDMLASGAPISAQRALAIGLIDEVVIGDPVDAGIAYANRLVAANAAARRTCELSVDRDGFDTEGIAAVLAKHAKALKGRSTQHEIVQVIQTATETPFEEGLAIEGLISSASLRTTESLALRHVFFAERGASKVPGLRSEDAVKKLQRAAVVGAGTMGAGIAMALSDAGLDVSLIDVNDEALSQGLDAIRGNYEKAAKRGRLTEQEAGERMSRIQAGAATAAARDADIVIEAVYEDMALKKRVLSELDQLVPARAILASNTSSLSLTELASVTSRPERVIGLHFFSPAHVMRLLEIVRSRRTSLETIAAGLALAKSMRKIGVVVGDGFGFVGNRTMLDGYFREAELMLLEGATPQRLDRVMEDFGFAMGPNRVNDLAGVDVGTKVRVELLKREPRPHPYFVVSDALTPLGRLGQKVGKGVYRYEPGSREPLPDPEVEELIAQLAESHGVAKRALTDEEIQERCVLSLVNIGAQILDEGVAYRAADIDVIWTSGYGFPRWRGGPMFHADMLGLEHVLQRVRFYHDRYGGYWAPAPLLAKLGASGKTFAGWDAEAAERGRTPTPVK